MRQVTIQVEAAARPDLAPPLKWAGGKRWLLPSLKTLWSPHAHRRLVEPFAGGLSVALGLRPQQALLNDVNPHLVNFYRHLQQGLEVTVPMDFDPDVYYARRKAFNALIDRDEALEGPTSKRAAMLFYYLNRHCYNGICRFNGKGRFNTPIGRFVNPKYDLDLRPYAAALAGWTFSAVDFAKVKLKPGDFVYADPPYDAAYTGYSAGGFSSDDQRRLAEMLAKHDGPVVLSNNATPAMMELYEELDFDTSRQEWAPRMIKFRGKPLRVKEVLATRNLD
jgi:DNA adenine methylase